MFAQPRAVLIFNNDMFVILTAMTEKQGSESIKSAFMTDDNKKAKPIAGIAMARIIVTAALLLSGLALIGSYQQQPVIAQQQNTTGGGGNVTTDTTTTTTGGAGTQGGNATTGAARGNQSEARFHIEEARTALQNNDTQAALMHLDLALNTLGGAGGIQANMTTGTSIAGTDDTNTDSEDAIPTVGGSSAADEDNEIADNDAADSNDGADESNSNTDANSRETDTEEEEDSECGAVTVGGTSAADDYGCPPDPDY
jgi:hypothetical protein